MAAAGETAPGPGADAVLDDSGLQVCCSPLVAGALSVVEAERLAAVLKAVADPTRLRLLSMVAAQEGGEACVCDLTSPVGLTQPTVSHHLKILVDAGLLTRDKRGVWAYYQLVPGALDVLGAALSRLEVGRGVAGRVATRAALVQPRGRRAVSELAAGAVDQAAR